MCKYTVHQPPRLSADRTLDMDIIFYPGTTTHAGTVCVCIRFSATHTHTEIPARHICTHSCAVLRLHVVAIKVNDIQYKLIGMCA